RGNNQSMFYASGGYEPIARVFSRARFQRFLLEYDDERSGGFEPLRAVPEDRLVVLGLVTTKKPRVETVDELRERIAEAARLTPLPRAPAPPIWSKNLGKDGDYVVLAPGWHHAVKAPVVKPLNDAHAQRLGRPADPIAGPAYACVQILAAAITKAGAADREKI